MDDKEANLRFEKELWSKGFKHIAGVDEAGRGPVLGPMVIAGIIIDKKIDGVKDSKQLTKEKREKLEYLKGKK